MSSVSESRTQSFLGLVRPMILFLDFDGVLHPMFPREDLKHAENQHFSYMPRLESVLRDFPHVDIVVSSDWRKMHTLEQLRGFFSPDIAQRIIGVTPAVERVGVAVSYAERVRHSEVLAWLDANGHAATPWLALDDDPENFPPPAPLVLCADGFHDVEEAALRSMLREGALP